ncbi:MAG TPA: SRPBCC domain-containing protein [Vicinamibacterales bacterium]|nr:SRPBCC domain-containing protein [Vicinamibacterales bacterium]
MTNDPKRTERVLDLTIDIDATLEEVWQALTTGEGIARWFAPHAAVTPGEGGSVSVGWDPNEMWTTPITVWEPLRHMQTASEMPSKDGRVVRLAVDYYLEAQGGRVRVRLVHSGFDDSESWDGYIDGLDAGWTFFLFNLKHALERHRGVDRQQLSARFRTTARRGEDHPVFGAKGLHVRPSIGGLQPGDGCHLSLGGVEVDAIVAVRHAPRTVAFLVPAWNDALLFVEREGMKETHQLGMWLSLYGVPETTAASLRQGLSDVEAALSTTEK